MALAINIERELKLARNMLGPLSEDTRQRVRDVVDNPTPETWDAAPIGWATMSGGTTGGGSATPTTVTTLSQLNTAAGGSNAAVIHVSAIR